MLLIQIKKKHKRMKGSAYKLRDDCCGVINSQKIMKLFISPHTIAVVGHQNEFKKNKRKILCVAMNMYIKTCLCVYYSCVHYYGDG